VATRAVEMLIGPRAGQIVDLEAGRAAVLVEIGQARFAYGEASPTSPDAPLLVLSRALAARNAQQPAPPGGAARAPEGPVAPSPGPVPAGPAPAVVPTAAAPATRQGPFRGRHGSSPRR
jgi:hypothetical protein